MVGLIETAKTYAVALLAGALGLVLVAATIGVLWQQHRLDACRRARAADAGELANLRAANAGALETVRLLREKNAALADALRTDSDEMRAAAARQAALETQLAAAAADARRAREALAKENHDVAAYLDSGMPCELARQLWGEAGYCAH